MLHRFAVAAAVTLALLAAHPAPGAPIVLPSLGVAGSDLPEVTEREIGEEMMRGLRDHASFLQDPETSYYLARLGNRLVAAGHPSPYNFEFFPLRIRDLNAFAMPGGFVAVNSGLILAAQSESELAGVLAHEVSHVTQRHIARMLEQGKGGSAITLGSTLLAILAGIAGSPDAAAAIFMGTQAGMVANQLSHSRAAEREADRVGLDTLSNAGFDPRGMMLFFQRLMRDTMAYERDATRYLSTHPLTTERIADMRNRLPHYKAKDVPSSQDFLLVQARMLVLQEQSRQGFLDKLAVLKRQAAESKGARLAAAHYGLAVCNDRLGNKDEAARELREARRLVGAPNPILEMSATTILWRAAKTQADKDSLVSQSAENVKRWPLLIMLTQAHAELLQRAGRHKEAVRFLRGQHAMSRQNEAYYMLMAKSHEALGQRSLQHQALGEAALLRGEPQNAHLQFSLAQQAGDADFYTMSEIDARVREFQRAMQKQGQKKP